MGDPSAECLGLGVWEDSRKVALSTASSWGTALGFLPTVAERCASHPAAAGAEPWASAQERASRGALVSSGGAARTGEVRGDLAGTSPRREAEEQGAGLLKCGLCPAPLGSPGAADTFPGPHVGPKLGLSHLWVVPVDLGHFPSGQAQTRRPSSCC